MEKTLGGSNWLNSEEMKSEIQEVYGEDEFYKNFDKFVQTNYDVVT